MKKRSILAALLSGCLLLSGCGQTGHQTAQEPIRITWYLRTEDVDLYNSLEGIKQIEQATGVDVIFQSPPDNSEDAFKMMVASGKLPDVIMWQYSGSVDKLYTSHVAIDLTELIAEHAPNLNAIFQKRPELRREVENTERRLYYFPSINPMQTKEEIGRKAYNGMIVREDWLNKLGLSPPDTIHDWYNMLTAFKTMDPNSNGLQDEIPFDGWGLQYFAPAFGVLSGICVKRDGTVAYGPMEQEYKHYLETMYKWYAEGLLGSNSIINSNKWKDENIISNLTGAFQGLDNAWRYYLPSLQEKDPAALFKALPWPMDDAGVRYTPRTEMAGHVATTITFITTQCGHPEDAVRFIDYMYSQKGGDLLHWGIEGLTYEVDDGVKKLTEYALSPSDAGYLTLYHYAIGHASFPKYDGETVVLASYPEDQLIAEWTWADASVGLIYPPGISMTTADQEKCSGTLQDVSSYAAEMEIKFITGQEPLSNYDNFVSNLKRMGIDEALAIYRDYHRRYIESAR